MNYQISDGIPESGLSAWLAKAAKKYGVFEDGRINYKGASLAPAVMCTVLSEDKILLVKRAYGLADANGYWSIINGFIDEDKSVSSIASNEFGEELGWDVKPQNIKVAKSLTVKGEEEKRDYIIFPCLLSLPKQLPVTLDREHTDFAWIDRSELENYHILDDLPIIVDAALELL